MDRHGLTDADLCELANDQEFQRIIETDAVLDKYDEETYDEKKEFFSLIWFLGLAPVAVGRLPLRPLSPAKWAFLWGIGNAYAREKKDAKPLSVQGKISAIVFIIMAFVLITILFVVQRHTMSWSKEVVQW